MMMRKTIRFVSYALTFLGLGAVQVSCSSNGDEADLCYKCTYDGDNYTVCFDDYKDEYGGSQNDFEDWIDSYWRADGYTCTKKK